MHLTWPAHQQIVEVAVPIAGYGDHRRAQESAGGHIGGLQPVARFRLVHGSSLGVFTFFKLLKSNGLAAVSGQAMGAQAPP